MLRISRYAAALAAGLLLCSCTKAGQSVATHDLRIADGSGDIPTLNPHLFTEAPIGYIAQMTQAYLVKYDARNQPYPELLTSVPTQANGGISKDGDTITWHLRKGVRWSDGAPFTADDLVFSTKVVLNPANNEVGRDGWNLITKIDEPDKYTVVYHLRHPYASYEPTFFGSAGANPTVLPQASLGAVSRTSITRPYNAKPVGIGPFRIVDWRRGEGVDMEPNPYYFRGMPKLKRVYVQVHPVARHARDVLQTGDVDVWPQAPASFITRLLGDLPTSRPTSSLRRGTRISTLTLPGRWSATCAFAKPYAMRSTAPTLVAKVVHGYGFIQESTVSPNVPIAPNIPFVSYDPAKAKQLLDAAGWRVGPDGIRVKNGARLSLQFPYYTGSSAADQTVEFLEIGIQGSRDRDSDTTVLPGHVLCGLSR